MFFLVITSLVALLAALYKIFIGGVVNTTPSKPVLVLCSSNAGKLAMYKKLIPLDLITSAVTVKLDKDEITEIQGASQEVIEAKLRSYFKRVGMKFPPGSVFLIDDTIFETSGEHNPKVAGFPGASTTYLFPQPTDPPGTRRFKGRLHELITCGGVWYTCSIGLIRTDGASEFYEGTVKGTFVPLPEEKENTPKNIDPQFRPDGEDKTLDDKDDKHPRHLAVMEMMANSKLIIELLKARDC
jgi:inosine/xanthosine triphosphate pyrophosphatase family protein